MTCHVAYPLSIVNRMDLRELPFEQKVTKDAKGNRKQLGPSAQSVLSFGVAEVVRLQEFPNSHEFGDPQSLP